MTGQSSGKPLQNAMKIYFMFVAGEYTAGVVEQCL